MVLYRFAILRFAQNDMGKRNGTEVVPSTAGMEARHYALILFCTDLRFFAPLRMTWKIRNDTEVVPSMAGMEAPTTR